VELITELQCIVKLLALHQNDTIRKKLSVLTNTLAFYSRVDNLQELKFYKIWLESANSFDRE
jgi:hypothetical protein